MKDLWFDGRYINPSQPDGISRFSLGLIRELAKLTELSVLVSSRAQQRLMPDSVRVLKVNHPSSPREVFLARRLKRQGIAVLFSPMQVTSSIFRDFKLISTLHDLIYYRHRKPPEQFNVLIKVIWFLFHMVYWPQRILLNKADAVVTVSHTTKRQMLATGLTKREITVIHNAAEPCEFVDRTNRSHSRDLVYMGSFIGYKNVETLIRGMGEIPDHRLLLTSRISARRRAELAELANEVGGNVEFLDGVSDEEYFRLLRESKALVSASLDEGFGIPLVEAMERGTPVVTSDIEIFEEVAGPAGLRFSPTDAHEFASQVRALDDATLWQELSEQSLKQSDQFTWPNSARKLLELCQKVALT
jgi:glycosyltransferase involved in cell wall biosynthesis